MSKRYYFTLPDKIAEALDYWADLEGNKPSSLAGFIVEQAVRQQIESSRLPIEIFGEMNPPRYEKFKHLLLDNYDKLSEDPYLKSRMGWLLEGHRPTIEDKLRIVIVTRFNEQYLDNLIEASFANGNGNKTNV